MKKYSNRYGKTKGIAIIFIFFILPLMIGLYYHSTGLTSLLKKEYVANLSNEIADILDIDPNLLEDIISNNVEIMINYIYEIYVNPKHIEYSYRYIADNLSIIIRDIGPIDLEDSDVVYEKLKRNMYRFNHIAKVLNDKLGVSIPLINLRIFEKSDVIKLGLSYMPIVGTYNKLYMAACKLPSNDDRDYIRFYKDLFLFFTDLIFIEEKVGYKTAFTTTRKIAYTLKLYKLRRVIGNSGYGLLLSEIHWLIREEVTETWDDIISIISS